MAAYDSTPYSGPGYPSFGALHDSIQTGLAGLVQAQTASRAQEVAAWDARTTQIREDRKFELDLQTTLLNAARERRKEEREAAEHLIKLQSLQLERQQTDLKLQEAQLNLNTKQRQFKFEEENGQQVATISAMTGPVERERAWRALAKRPGFSFAPAKWLEAREKDEQLASSTYVLLEDGSSVSAARAADMVDSENRQVRAMGLAATRVLGGNPESLPGYATTLAGDINRYAGKMSRYSADAAPAIRGQLAAVGRDAEARELLARVTPENFPDQEERERVYAERLRLARAAGAEVRHGYIELSRHGLSKQDFEVEYLGAPRQVGGDAAANSAAVVGEVITAVQRMQEEVARGRLDPGWATKAAATAGEWLRNFQNTTRRVEAPGANFFSADTADAVVHGLTPLLLSASLDGTLTGVNSPADILGEEAVRASASRVAVDQHNQQLLEAMAQGVPVDLDQFQFASADPNKPALTFVEAAARYNSLKLQNPEAGTLDAQHLAYLEEAVKPFLVEVPSDGDTPAAMPPEDAADALEERGYDVVAAGVRKLADDLMPEVMRTSHWGELRGSVWGSGLRGRKSDKPMTAEQAKERALYVIRTAEFASGKDPRLPAAFIQGSVDDIIGRMGNSTSLRRGLAVENPIVAFILSVGTVVFHPYETGEALGNTFRPDTDPIARDARAQYKFNLTKEWEEPLLPGTYGKYNTLSGVVGGSLVVGAADRVAKAVARGGDLSDVAEQLVLWQGFAQAAEETLGRKQVAGSRGVAVSPDSLPGDVIEALTRLYKAEFAADEPGDLAAEIARKGGDYETIKAFLALAVGAPPVLGGRQKAARRAKDEEAVKDIQRGLLDTPAPEPARTLD